MREIQPNRPERSPGIRARGGRRALAACAAVGAALAAVLTACAPARPAAVSSNDTVRAPSAGFSTGPRHALAAQYLLIARAGNRRLEEDFDGLEDGDWGNLAAARADLLDAAATERLFDRRLLTIGFPPVLASVARALAAVNETRASLTTRAAASTSLGELRRYEPRLGAANEPVERRVRTIRSELGLPPPETS